MRRPKAFRPFALAVVACLCVAAPALADGPAGAPSPSCLPASLDASARLAGTPLLVSPMPGSADATVENQISFLGAPAAAIGALAVSGSLSGPVAGSLEAYSQGDGASFVPAAPLLAGETVSVAGIYMGAGGAVQFSFSFTVASTDPIAELPEHGRTTGAPGTVLHFNSEPSVTPPRIEVFHDSPAAASGGDIFLSVYPGPGETGPEIMAPDGRLVWFLPLATGTFATNLRVQSYAGRRVLTWWQGAISHHGFGLGEGEIYDDHYRPLATVAAGNGLAEDLHELQLTPQGTALITAWKPIFCDLRPAGGAGDVALYDPVMQEIDVASGLVEYEWDSLDHVPLSDSYVPVAQASVPWPWDWFHMNSIELESDGSWLISSRDTSTVFDVDSSTGQIVWRLGGRQSSFRMGPGAEFSWQHDARRLSSGLYTLFDNGGPPSKRPHSRGLILALDLRRRTASLVRQLLPPSPLWAQTQGDVQLLPSGDAFVGWGDIGEISEISASGKTLYVAHSPRDTQIYRALRFSWFGEPATPPTLVARPTATGPTTLYASWNGATNVVGWRVFEGRSATQLMPYYIARASGFETKLVAPRRAAFACVEAIGRNGHLIGTSPVLALRPVAAPRRGHPA